MTKSIDADRDPNGTEPQAHEQAREARASRHVMEDSTSGSEYADDRLRLDD